MAPGYFVLQMPDQVGHDGNWRANKAFFVTELAIFESSSTKEAFFVTELGRA